VTSFVLVSVVPLFETTTAATPAFGIELAAREVDSGIRCPAHGSCAGCRGMLFLGSRPKVFGSSKTGQLELDDELSMRRA